MSDAPAGPYRFGSCRLDAVEKTLVLHDRPVALTPKVFETLLALVERAGHLVTKDDLLQRVWPDSFVEEASLAQNISVLRKILGDDPHEPRFIETVPKRGYRFVAEVTRREIVEATAVIPPAAVAPELAPLAARRWTRVSIPALALIVLIAGGSYFGGPSPAPVPPPPARVLIAVLPFVNLTGDPADEYLSGGLTEELITQLGRLNPVRLGVIARASVAQQKALAIGYVVEGTLRREGSRIRVTARMTQMPERTVVWTDAYEQDPREILTTQLRVSRAVAGQIQARLSLPPPRVPLHLGTENHDAQTLFLKARHFWSKRTADMASQAIALYQQAIALDPRFALAYAEMSRCYLSSPSPDARTSFELAAATARKALAIDDGLGDAHFALATAALHLFDWRTATREFERAEVLDPALRNIDFMVISGRFEEAIGETRRGLEIDPANILIRHGAGINAFYARQYQSAVDHYRQALELDPNYVYSKIRLGQALTELRQYDEAIRLLEQAGPQALGQLGYFYGVTGRRADAMDVLRRMAAWSPTQNSLDNAVVHTGLGDKEEAFRWLNTAFEERSYHLIYLRVDPRFDSLRSDMRYDEFMRRVGFPAF